MSPRYYLRNQILVNEEDVTHEFKVIEMKKYMLTISRLGKSGFSPFLLRLTECCQGLKYPTPSSGRAASTVDNLRGKSLFVTAHQYPRLFAECSTPGKVRCQELGSTLLIGMSYRKVGDFSILGGKVYMGVDDEGRVGGFMMCPFQRDHFSLAMHGKNDW